MASRSRGRRNPTTWPPGRKLNTAPGEISATSQPAAGSPGPRTLVQQYQDEFEDDVELRLQQAGAPGLRTCFGATSLNLDAQIPMIMHGRGLERCSPEQEGQREFASVSASLNLMNACRLTPIRLASRSIA